MSFFPTSALRPHSAGRLGLAILLGCTAAPVFATTVHVTTPEDKIEKILAGQPEPKKCSLREAIMNASAGKVVAGKCEAPEPIGSITPTTIVFADDSVFIKLTIADEMVVSGGALVELQGPATIDGNGQSRKTRVLRVSTAQQPNPETASFLHLKKMTINNAIETGSGGVALVETGTSIEVEDSTFINNKASIGGVFSLQGRAKVFRSQFEVNYADYYGAVIGMGNTSVELHESLFENNASRLAGGAVYCKGASNGYGLKSYANQYLENMSSPQLKAEAPFSANLPENAPYLDPDAHVALGGALFAENCTFLSNGDVFAGNRVVGKGAAIYSSVSKGEVRRAVIRDNSVDGTDKVAEQEHFGGGGLFVIGGISLLGNTVMANSVVNGDGGGMFFKSAASDQVVMVANNTIAENRSVGWVPSNQGPLPWGQGQPLSFPGLGSGAYFDDKVRNAYFINNTVYNNTAALAQIAITPPLDSSFDDSIVFANNIVVNTTGESMIHNCMPESGERMEPGLMSSNVEWDSTKPDTLTCKSTEKATGADYTALIMPIDLAQDTASIDIPGETAKSTQTFYVPKPSSTLFYVLGLSLVCDTAGVNWLDQLYNQRPFGDSCVPGSLHVDAP